MRTTLLISLIIGSSTTPSTTFDIHADVALRGALPAAGPRALDEAAAALPTRSGTSTKTASRTPGRTKSARISRAATASGGFSGTPYPSNVPTASLADSKCVAPRALAPLADQRPQEVARLMELTPIALARKRRDLGAEVVERARGEGRLGEVGG
jgi:hypothetical protein